MITEIYDITGMHCAACSSAVERVTRKLPGVVESQVNLTMARLTITYDETQTTEQMICDKIARAGFGAVLHVEENKPAGEDVEVAEEKADKKKLYSLIVSSVFSGLLLFVSMGHMLGMPLPGIVSSDTNPQNFALLQLLLAIPVIGLGHYYYTSGFSSLFHGNPNMNTLVAISSVASLAYSIALTFMLESSPHLVHGLYYESSAVVVALVSVGKYLESRSERKTKSALRKLKKLAPDLTSVVENGKIKRVSTSSVGVGQVILVRAGEHIPLDGIVTDGYGSADEAMLTGESMPVEKEPEATVIGGSILQSGALYVKVTRTGSETMLSQIIKFVEDAQGKKAPISKTADKVAGVFVPVVMAIAIIVAVLWLILGEGIPFALKIFTSVLVIACPCAMGLATPTAIMVGTGLGASRGILIRSGEALEILHSVDTVVFDKTGTVTEGRMSLSELVTSGVDEDDLLSLMGAVEILSDHPIAKAISNTAAERVGEISYEVEDFSNLSGLGLKAHIVSRGDVLLGNQKLMNESGVDISSLLDAAEKSADEGKTIVFASLNGVAIGYASVSDKIKPGVAETVAALSKMNINTVLLTGDNRSAAAAIAKEAGISDVISEVLPNEKAGVIEEIKRSGKRVMMVGDGINDAPALTSADIGAAVGSGSDIAIDSADIVLMHDDPADIVRAIRLGRYTITNIKQNLFWAFCYNVLAIPIAAGVLYPAFGITLTPMIGSIAMSLSSIFVVTNALRLGRKNIDKLRR